MPGKEYTSPKAAHLLETLRIPVRDPPFQASSPNQKCTVRGDQIECLEVFRIYGETKVNGNQILF